MVLLLAEGLAISISQFIQLAIFQTQTFTRCDSLQVATAAGKEKKMLAQLFLHTIGVLLIKILKIINIILYQFA